MSLINQMLQELEQRRAESGAATAQVHAAPSQTRVPASRRWVLLALIASGMAAAAGVGYWFVSHQAGGLAAPAVPPAVLPAVTRAAAPHVNPPVQRTETELQALQLSLVLDHPPPVGEMAPVSRPLDNTSAAAAPARNVNEKGAAIDPFAAVPDIKSISSQQRAENAYRQAYANLQQGRLSEAEEGLHQVLQLDPRYAAARQALAALLVETSHLDRAEQVLQQGLELQPGHTGYAMTLARLQVERGDVQGALATLQNNPPAGENAEYHAFIAALLQRSERHKEAINQFLVALRSNPASGPWLLGLGISLQADNQTAKAAEVFRRARQSGSLSPDLQAFAEQRLKALQ